MEDKKDITRFTGTIREHHKNQIAIDLISVRITESVKVDQYDHHFLPVRKNIKVEIPDTPMGKAFYSIPVDMIVEFSGYAKASHGKTAQGLGVDIKYRDRFSIVEGDKMVFDNEYLYIIGHEITPKSRSFFQKIFDKLSRTKK